MSVCGFSKTFTVLKCFLLISVINLVSGSQWYRGCAWSNITTSDPSYVEQQNVATTPTTCCSECYQNGYEYAAIGNDTCWCGNNFETAFEASDNHCNEICEEERPQLLCGSTDTVSIYATEGPYLLQLSLSKGSTMVQTGITSLFDARIELAAATDIEIGISNVAAKDLEHVNFTWSVNGSAVKQSIKSVTNSSTTSSLIYTFRQVGVWFIGVTASNAISHRTARTVLHVVQPVPSDLQVILRPGQGNIPSCVPEHDNLMSNLPAVAVFVDEPAEFQAYLSIGINLTFDWWFNDDGSHVTSMPYLEEGESCDVIMCLHSHQAHIFNQEGLFTVTVNASNELGSAQKTLHVIVMNRGINNLSLSLVEGSHFTTPNTSLIFSLKMETADREQAVLSLDFDDGTVYNQSLRDVNETFISGGSANPANMYLTASYGDGCQLIVSFSHKYAASGSYGPKTLIQSNRTAYLAELSEAIVVQRSIEYVELESSSSYPLGSEDSIIAVVPFKTYNMTYEWRVKLGNGTITADTTQNGSIIQVFDFEGQYVVQVTVRNLVSQASALKVVRVQRAITQVTISDIDQGFVVPVDQIVTLEASTESGTDPTFHWNFDNGSTFSDMGQQDASGLVVFSIVNHTFAEVGNYNISVTASNLVSAVTQRLDQLIIVQEPIVGLSSQSVHPTTLNQTSRITLRVIRGSHVKFIINENGKDELLQSELHADGMFVITTLLSGTGLHYLNITAYNNVSEASTEATLLVQEPINNFTVSLLPLSLGKVAVIATFDGELNRRDDLLYQWIQDEMNITTSSGVFIIERDEITDNSSVIASNLVDKGIVYLPNNVSESPFLLSHPHYVEINSTVSFTLSLQSGLSMRSVGITYRHNSTGSETVTMPIASPVQEVVWSRTFSMTGLWLMDIIIVDTDNRTVQSTSVVSVQESVSDVNILGPALSRFEWPSTTVTWELRPSTGSSIMYEWEIIPLDTNSSSGINRIAMGGSNTLAYIPFWMPGTYNLTLTASNEISRTSTHTLTTLREPITNLVLSSNPVLHGLNSTISFQVRGGLEFTFSIDYGDGTQQQVSSDSPDMSLESIDHSTQPATYVFTLRKHYADLGEYAVVATVSNGVSDMDGSTVVRVEERITGLTIVTSNSWLVNVVDNITVEATVHTGNDIVFTWDFNDMTGPTTTIHSNGSYSAVIHTFGKPGEYYISVSASNALQQDPLIYHYPTHFVVQQVPVALELNVYEGNNWASLEQDEAGDWQTDTITFRALCWGSHINFAFDYGDGYEEVIEGQLGLVGNYYGLGTHAYTAEGEFHVSVTAFNLLTNVTQSLGTPFIVVISPNGLYFDHAVYTFPFGNMSVLTVTVDEGNNLFFNWSMGDQTNYLFAGPSVTHVYRTAASYNVTVVAFNKVQSLQTACTVDIVNFVSFVDLKVESQLATTYTKLVFTAETPANSAKWFRWDMGNGHPIRQTSVNTLTHRYTLPGIYYVSVEAGNHMSNATSNPVEMTLQALIGTMIITASAPALFGQRTVLEVQVYSGSNIEYVWDFGDSSPYLITEQSVVLHSYNRTGEYFINVFASNDVSNSSASTNVFILDEPCLAPELYIVGDSSRTINFSNPIKLEIEVFIDCDITQETTYHWSLIDAVVGSPLLLDPMVASLDKRTLYIPSHVVPIGSYSVSAEVHMNNTIVYSRTSLSLTIRESLLIAVIEGGTTRTIDRNTLAYINGGFSIDPDHPSDSNLQYNWTCHPIDIPFEPCFDPLMFPNDTAPVPSTNGSLLFPAAWLRLDMAFQFVFYLTVSKEGRQPDSVSQVLKVVSNEKIYELLVDCPSCDESIVNSNAELTLEALCPTCGDNVTFVWELFVIWDGSTTYSNSASRCNHADGSGSADSETTIQTSVTPLTSSQVNTAGSQATSPPSTPVQHVSTPGIVHTSTSSQSPTSSQTSPMVSSPDGQGTSPTFGTTVASSTSPTALSSSPASLSTTSSHSGPDWSSSSSSSPFAESLPESSFLENIASSSALEEYYSDEGGVFESVFEDSVAAVETKQDNYSDDLTQGRSMGTSDDGATKNKSVSTVEGRSGFFEALSSSSSFVGETLSSSSSSVEITEDTSSSSDMVMEADDSSSSESFGFAEVVSSSVGEVASSSSSIQEEPPTADLSTMLPTSTATLTTSDPSTPSEASSSTTGNTIPHSTTRQPIGGIVEDSLLEDYSESSYEYPDDSSYIGEESSYSIGPTTRTTSGLRTSGSSTTPPQPPEEHVDVDDGSSIQEGDDTLYPEYSSDAYGGGGISSVQSSANDGDDVANPDNPVTYEEHIVSRSSQAVVVSEESTLSGLKGKQFTLRPGVLEEGRTYAVGVKVYPEDGSPGVQAEAYQYVTVNEAPQLGICSISPDSGTELDTFFSAVCHSWKDEDTPLQYEVRYSLNQSDPETILYFGMDRSVRFLLPAGHAENNHNVYLKLAIVDSKGGKTSVCDIAIPVFPKSFESLENKLEYLDAVSVGSSSMLSLYVAHGDDLNITSHVRLVAHLLNQLSHVFDEDHDSDHCHVIAERCAIRSALLEGILALPIRDEYEILQVVGAINEVSSVPVELNAPCQRKISGLLTTLATSSARCRWEEPSLARDALEVMTMVASNILESFHHNHTEEILSPEDSRDITEKMVTAMIDMLQVYLGHMTTESAAVILTSPLLSLQGSRLGTLAGATFLAGGATFTLPPGLDALVGKPQAEDSWTDRYRWNYPCYDAHMVTYVDNPFMWGQGANKVTTPVASLELFSCDEDEPSLVNVSNLPAGEEILIDIDNLSEELQLSYNYTFDPAYMSVHSFNVSRTNIYQSFHISIRLTPIQRPIPITVLLRYGLEPTPTRYDLCWSHNDDINRIDIFLPPDSFNVSGRYYLALVDGEFGETVFRQDGDQTREYLLKMWWGECLYWDPAEVSWSPDGCSTSSTSTFDTTQCLCTHLSSFGVSFVPILSIVTFVDMQLFVGPNKNPVTYMFVAGLIGVYALLFIYCYYADRHDEKKQGLIYLKDNQPGDRQYYDITVETGFRTAAGTTARISIVLHGDEGHSETKELICDDKPIFERNSRDRFIISVPESLGNIQRLQLWHNNAGLSPSWYLSRVSVRDLLTGQKWFFICERWFAVEEDDGKIERELLVVEDGVGFTKAFFAKGSQYFADYYLWSSVFTRPPYSIFTRVQRLTCCLCISMGFMCVNTLWYQKLDKKDSELGVIDVSGEAVLVGIVTALIAIPINFPLIMLFRRSKPWRMPGEIGELFKHIKSNSKHQSDPEEQTAAQLYNLQRWAREKWKHRHKSSIFKHLSENESSRSSIDAHSYSSGFGELSSEDRFRAMFTDSDLTSPELTESWESLDPDPIPSTSHKKLKSPKIWLPHVFYFIAWGGSIFIVIASSVITIVLGLKFSYAQAIYWMQSMYFSFLQCIFITQPSVMAMLTIGKAWKHSNNIKIFDHYDDNTDLIDKRLLHRSRVQLYEQDLSKAIAARQRSRYLRFARPPQPKELQKAKEKMMKEKHMYAILK
ncbi:polycystin-1-like protein 1 [Lytechinus pictus]|uniref:polycystin-1-like protein 1 n=1 Tax=Lytechinus pictus TaxID=7653 RepID=UPI0030BA0CB7